MEYKDLEVWSEAMSLAKMIYPIVQSFPEIEKFSLVSQIKRSAISIPSNIAEGCGRQTSKDTIRFLYISRGSLYELETQILLANSLEYINQESFDSILPKILTTKRLLNGFINYYKNR